MTEAYFTLAVFILLIVVIIFIAKAVRLERKNDTQSRPTDVQKATISQPHHPKIKVSHSADLAEVGVDNVLRGLNEPRYFVFRDIIIPSPARDLSLTQIYHIVVSRYGIFCIETKSHQGDIYGYSRSERWKQYLGGKSFNLNSPFRKNRHHVPAVEILLKSNLRAPVHSYIAFPNAHKVVVDGNIEDMTPHGVIHKINKHTVQIYDLASVERIAKTLAHAATFRDELRDRHADEVRAYVDAKVAATLKYS